MSRVIGLRLGLYVLLVAVLVVLHPLDPVPMAIVATILALVVVITQQRWRLPARADWDPRHAHLSILVTLLVAAAGVTIVVAGVDDAVPRQTESLHSALLFLAIAMVFIGAGMFESVARREGGAWYPVAGAALVVLGTAYFMGLARLGTGWWSWVPLIAVLASPVFVGIVSEWIIERRRTTWYAARGRTSNAAPLVLLTLGTVAVLAAGAAGLLEWWVVWWLLTCLPAVALLGAARRRTTVVGLMLATTGIVVLPLVLVHRYHLPQPQVWLLTALLAVVILIAVDNNTDVLFIVILAAVTWSGLPRSVALDDHVQPDPSRPAMVAIGDSFMSGEGAQRYYEGTNRRVANECRRAPTAYPVQLAAGAVTAPSAGTLPDQVLLLACSGATTDHVVQRPQFDGEPEGGPPASQLEQLDRWVKERDLEVALVLVGLGGNDAGFGVIARTCFLPGPCDELGQRWVDQLTAPRDDLASTLERTYDAILEVVPGARVVAVPYPVPIAPRSCSDSTLTDAEHRFLRDHTVRLNAVMAQAADRSGIEFATPVEAALTEAGQVLCGDAEAGVNWLDLNPVGGSLAQTANPRNWLHNSLHPNELGHSTIAAVLADWLVSDQPASAPLGSGPEPPEPPRPVSLPAACDIPRATDVDACERAWMFQHASAALRGPSIVLLALVCCYWLVAIDLVAWWRARSR